MKIDLPRLFINIKTLKIEARKESSPFSNNELLLNRLLSAETDDSGLSSIVSELASRKDITANHRNGLKEFRERILQYTYPVQVLENHDYATVAEIFKRVNSQGKILVTAELELASIVPHWKGFAKHLRTLDFRGPSSKNPVMLFRYLGLRHSGACDFAGKNATPIKQLSEYQTHHIFPVDFMLDDEEAEKYRKRHGLGRTEFKEQINDANLTFISLGANQEIKKRIVSPRTRNFGDQRSFTNSALNADACLPEP